MLDDHDRLPTLFLSHGSPMHAIEPGAGRRCMGSARPHAAAAARGADGVRALGDRGADAHRQPAAGDDPRFRRLSGGALRDSLSGARRIRRSPRRRSRCSRTPASPPASTAAADSITARGCRCAGCIPTPTCRWCSSRCSPRSAPRATLRSGARSRRSPDDDVLIVGSGHTTHNLRDWMGNPRRNEPLRYAQEFRRLAARAARRARHGGADRLSRARRRTPRARIRPKSISCRCTCAWGAAGDDPRVERIVGGFEAGALRWIRTRSIRRIEAVTGAAVAHRRRAQRGRLALRGDRRRAAVLRELSPRRRRDADPSHRRAGRARRPRHRGRNRARGVRLRRGERPQGRAVVLATCAPTCERHPETQALLPAGFRL